MSDTSSPKRKAAQRSAVDWSLLEDAYGSAETIPRELAKLSRPNARARAAAIDRLEGRLCHQGSVYTATAAAIPLLLERARARSQKDKAAIVAMLVDMAVGEHTNFLDGALAAPRASKPPRHATVESRCFDAVRAGAPTFVSLLDDGDAATRAAAAFALAWLPDPARAHGRALRERAAVERDDAALASVLVALGHLAGSRDARARAALAEHLADEREVVATGAAIALFYVDRKELSSEARAILAKASTSRRLARTAQPWNGGRLGEHAGVVIAKLPALPRGRGPKADGGAETTRALASLRTLAFGQATAVAARLVRELFAGRSPKRWDAMSAEQRALLTAIVRTGLGTWRGDLDEALRSRGLPWLDGLPALTGAKQGVHRDHRVR